MVGIFHFVCMSASSAMCVLYWQLGQNRKNHSLPAWRGYLPARIFHLFSHSRPFIYCSIFISICSYVKLRLTFVGRSICSCKYTNICRYNNNIHVISIEPSSSIASLILFLAHSGGTEYLKAFSIRYCYFKCSDGPIKCAGCFIAIWTRTAVDCESNEHRCVS